MARVMTVLCDKCGAPGADSLEITSTKHGDWAVDLCETCISDIHVLKHTRGGRFRKVALPPQPGEDAL
jgi:hypothetical protein